MTGLPRFAPQVLPSAAGPNVFTRNTPFSVAIGALLKPPPVCQSSSIARRTKIWDLSHHVHCSIVGTCLSTIELRQILLKANLAVEGLSDHELHSQGVSLASQRDGLGKLLHKALDRHHRLSINRFDKAATVEEVRGLWQDASKSGDIPGAYWAAVTHRAATSSLVREIFGEVHMLSHLVGAANRADIRRLQELEIENAKLRAKVDRQQSRLHDGFTTRDARIHELNAALANHISDEGRVASSAEDDPALASLVAALDRKLRGEGERRVVLEERVARLTDRLRKESDRALAGERREFRLREELATLQHSLDRAYSDVGPSAPIPCLAGRTVLYVGGRPDKVGHLRTLGEKYGVMVVHHDGGIDDRSGRLAAAVGRADVVMFPVDCVSHGAMTMVKRLCRQTLKTYVPLRSAGMGSFIAALDQAVTAWSSANA